MKNYYLIDVFVPSHSRGLMVDALVLKQALGEDKVRIITYPSQACNESIIANDKLLSIETAAENAVFIERLFEYGKLKRYQRRICLCNPEWLTSRDANIAKNLITEFWHKSKFGMSLLEKVFPNKRHEYIGFTSLNNNQVVRDYGNIAHFRGKSKTRHTQDIIDIWMQNPKLPRLTLQAYGGDIKIPAWIILKNLRCYLGFLDEEELSSEILKHGVHICTSQMEGFGHYINEARSIGALIIALDAPPMNELVDAKSGIMIPVEKYYRHNHGVRFVATKESIANGIAALQSMSMEHKKSLGFNARIRFFEEQKNFQKKLHALLF